MAKRSPESDDDFMRMQQEAIRRVREMQNRARATLENAGMHIESHDDPFPASRDYPDYQPIPQSTLRDENPVQNQIRPNERQNASLNETVFEREEKVPVKTDVNIPLKMDGLSLSLDHDQLLLLSIILMLMQDGADKWLLLSLAYVLIS